MKNKIYAVANYKGDLVGHDLTLSHAQILCAEMREAEPEEEWEVI